MRQLAYILMTLLMLAAAPVTAQEKHVTMRLVAEGSARPGGTVTLAIDARPAPGWHGYWQNPGDAGIETTAKWAIPAGWSAGPLRYPVPERLVVAGLMNFVYERPFTLLVDLSVPATAAVGQTVPVRVHLDYLVCTRELCVPESQDVATTLIVATAAPNAYTRAAFDHWRRALPKPLGSPATYQVDNGRFRLSVPYPQAAALGEGWFYPLAEGAVAYAAPQSIVRDGDRLVMETQAASKPKDGEVAGVLATGDGQGFLISATRGVVPPARGGSGAGWIGAALVAFAGAVLGGLVLNVMPCVFPILSLKALSLARGGVGPREARGEALAYTAGVVLVCLGLGGAILALRAGGSAVGWAFQLQDPVVVAVLLILCVAIALNLSGAFEFATPRFAGESGAGGAFATGALAAFVATPCTGPFMAAALGAALVLPWPAALAVFGGLGLGLALPFLLIGFVPALRARLPRPGAWMTTLRRILAVPMWLTAAALGWLLARQLGSSGWPLALLAAAATAVVLWWGGRRQAMGQAFGTTATVGLVLVAVATATFVHSVPLAAAGATVPLGAERFSEARLAQLRASGRPVFAYFTADWCLTCKVNEKVAIETTTAADAFRQGDVTVLVGDWTDGDPALGRFIERHNRAGVPLYLWYAPGTDAKVLPQVLTPGILASLPTGR